MTTPLSDAEKKRVAEIVALIDRLEKVLKSVMPDATGEEIGTLAHNLADYWDIATKHKQRIDTILKFSGSKDRKALAEELADLMYGDVDGELPYHLESMKETLPKLIERLEK